MSSKNLPQLYSSLHSFTGQTLPDDCRTRLANLLWMMSGMFLSGSVQLNHIARKTPLRAKKLSTVKRFSRFLDNPRVRTRVWYDPFARWMLQSAGSGGQVHLIIDATRVAFGFRGLSATLKYLQYRDKVQNQLATNQATSAGKIGVWASIGGVS
jgi:hypothetical protein